MSHLLPIEMLRAGEAGEVVEVTGEGRLVARLAESGLRIGTRLQVVAVGDPFVCKVGETKLSIRTDGAVEILVQPCAS